MFYIKNLPNWERVVRLIVSFAVITWALLSLNGVVAWIVAASAAGITLSGIFGFCPMCVMVGRRLDKAKGK
ncbi:YgaP family membrane protein [Undibacterium sp. TJN25]|uniref:YgaP family membrane protein n=1 Tax=Undibacterium sp. TJN25 TaxID=3413056 RepID=UPI003BF25B92